MGGRPDGNRQDNRQRGNAAQLLEKYKSMARDAQLAGDRVQTEYYLQYADHYYRILGESRARFEEQRRQRGEFDDDDGDDEQMEAGDDQRSSDDGGDDDDRPERDERFERERPQPRESRERYERPERAERPERTERAERPERPERPERAAQPDRGPRRPRYGRNGGEPGDGTTGDAPQAGNAPVANFESIAFDALPPAIGRDSPAGEPEIEQEAARPKRRAARKPRPADDDGEVAPAA